VEKNQDNLTREQKIRIKGGTYEQTTNSAYPSLLVQNNTSVIFKGFLDDAKTKMIVLYGKTLITVPRSALKES
jgi:hypothetical protein